MFSTDQFGIQVIAGPENFISEVHFLKAPTRASLLGLAESIYYI